MTDVHGNHVAYAEIPQPAAALVILNEVVLEIPDPGGEPLPPARLPEASLPLTYLQTEQELVNAYRQPVWKDEAALLAKWVSGLPGGTQPRNAYRTARWLTGSIHQQITYRRRSERGTQSPATTLQLGTGSCRDMATLGTEALRALGMPARFVSGYLNSAVSAAGLGSTHAWLEVYFPDGGWRGFDATSGRATGPDHIPTGVCAHPRGVMPISGSFDNTTGSSLGMKVELTIRRDSPAAPAPYP